MDYDSRMVLRLFEGKVVWVMVASDTVVQQPVEFRHAQSLHPTFLQYAGHWKASGMNEDRALGLAD